MHEYKEILLLILKMNIIIPLGGKSSRFFNEGYSISKPCIKIFNKPMLQHVLDQFDSINNDIFVFYYPECVETLIEINPRIKFIKINKQTIGPTETILLGLEYLISNNLIKFKKVMFFDCDTLYLDNLVNIFNNIHDKNIVFYRKDTSDTNLFSYIELSNEDNNLILSIKEKQKISNNANTGCYCFKNIEDVYKFSKYILENKISAFNGEPYISTIIDEMIKEDSFYGYEINSEKIFSLGTPTELTEYKKNRLFFLFDLDGTLVNTDSIYILVWQEIINLLDINIEINLDIYNNIIRGNSDQYVSTALMLPKYFDISNKKDELFIKYLDKIEIINESINFIKYCKKEKGDFISIVTNCNRYVAESIINKLEISDYIDYLIIGSECDKPKPSPDPYNTAIKLYNTTNDRVIIFEDSKTGLLSASSVYPNCIVAIESIYDEETLYNFGANIIIKDFFHPDGFSNLYNKIKNFKNHIFDDIIDLKKQILNSVSFRDDILDINIDNNRLKGGYISSVLSVNITLNDHTIIPCIIKLENKIENTLSKMAENLLLYSTEYYFYNSIRNFINIKSPKYYGIIKDDKLNNVGLLLENLYITKKCVPNLDLNKENISVIFNVIDNIVKMHRKFWDCNFKLAFPELYDINSNIIENNPKFFSWSSFIKKNYSNFKKKWNFLLTENNIKYCDDIVVNYDKIQTRIKTGKNLTLIHGDIKSPNIFYENDTKDPIFLDWQYTTIGKGAQDIVFFILESFNINTISYILPLIKNYYYCKIIEDTRIKYTYQEYLDDWNDSIKYFPFFVAIWFGTVPSDELIDKNFPFFLIQKLMTIYQ
jgi:beta-phosphoglucomutase-like phosphatase (HAD superfamily)/dTDP-glucose pyrophosphorylase